MNTTRQRNLRESSTPSEHLSGGERVIVSGTLHMVDGYESRIDLPGVLVGGYNAGSYKIAVSGTDEIVHAPRSAFRVLDVPATADAPIATTTTDEAPSDLDRVRKFLEDREAADELNTFTTSILRQLRDRGTLTDRQVGAILKDVEKVERQTTVIDRDQTPAVTQPGVYEKDGVIYVVKFNKEKTALYAKQIRELNSTRITEAGTVVEIEFDYAAGAIYKLAPEDKMPLERAKEYTIRYGRCIVCGRDLKKAESVERGIGPVCIKSFG